MPKNNKQLWVVADKLVLYEKKYFGTLIYSSESPVRDNPYHTEVTVVLRVENLCDRVDAHLTLVSLGLIPLDGFNVDKKEYKFNVTRLTHQNRRVILDILSNKISTQMTLARSETDMSQEWVA